MGVIRFLKVIKFVVYLKLISDVQCHKTLLYELKDNRSLNTMLDLLGVAETVIYSAKRLAQSNIRSDHNSQFMKPMDCAEVLEMNSSSKSGIYSVWLRSRVKKGLTNVYCDMEDDGGAWTVIQRRGDFDSPKDYFYRDWSSYKTGFGDPRRDFWIEHSLRNADLEAAMLPDYTEDVIQRRGDFDSPKDYFYRDWSSYKTGFGDPRRDFWIGNDNIFSLTNQRANTVKFTMSDWEGNSTYATYDDFWMDDEDHNYMMHVMGYRGTAGDGFSFTNGMPFTTKDNDHDTHASNCAVMFKGAWWYKSCHSSNLNGQYLKGAHESYADGVNWSAFRGNNYSLKDTVIKIRPKDFIKKTELDITPQ